MSLPFTVRPLANTAGWAARAMERGLRVTWRAGKFGRLEYVVRDDVAAVRLVQGEESPMRGVVDEPTLAQTILLKQLARLGVIELDAPRLGYESPPTKARRAGA